MNDNSATLCLHIPVAIPLGSRIVHGELALPAHATEVRVCVGDGNDRAARRRQARTCARRAIAALNIESAEMTSGDLLKIIDWVRSRRLLQPLPISLVTPSAQALAALKAAHHRPACVRNVLVTSSAEPTPKRRVRHLSLAYSA